VTDIGIVALGYHNCAIDPNDTTRMHLHYRRRKDTQTRVNGEAQRTGEVGVGDWSDYLD